MTNTSDERTKGMILSAPHQTEQIHEITETQNQSGAPSDGASACHSLVKDYLAGGLDLPSTIQKLFSSLKEPNAFETEPLEDYFQNLWYAILHSARHVSFRDTPSHKKLVDLVKAIVNSHFTGPSSSGEVPLELQLLGMCSREAYNEQPGSGEGFLAPEICAWTNLNYFLALVKNEDIMPYMYDIWALRQALEQDHVDDEQHDVHQPASAVQKYDAYVPAAAAWIFGEGNKLYLTEKDLSPTDPSQGNPGGGGDLWKGRAEYSKERWAFWKHRFGEMSEKTGLGEETRQIAKEAVEAMSEAEK